MHRRECRLGAAPPESRKTRSRLLAHKLGAGAIEESLGIGSRGHAPPVHSSRDAESQSRASMSLTSSELAKARGSFDYVVVVVSGEGYIGILGGREYK